MGFSSQVGSALNFVDWVSLELRWLRQTLWSSESSQWLCPFLLHEMDVKIARAGSGIAQYVPTFKAGLGGRCAYFPHFIAEEMVTHSNRLYKDEMACVLHL